MHIAVRWFGFQQVLRVPDAAARLSGTDHQQAFVDGMIGGSRRFLVLLSYSFSTSN